MGKGKLPPRLAARAGISFVDRCMIRISSRGCVKTQGNLGGATIRRRARSKRDFHESWPLTPFAALRTSSSRLRVPASGREIWIGWPSR